MYYVYILTNYTDKVLYTGVTNNLIRRIYEHKNKLVYYDNTNEVMTAIEREKQIKGWNRKKKISLINEFNPNWNDLYSEIIK